MTPLKTYNPDNEKLETQQSIDDSKSTEDSADLEFDYIKLDLVTPTENPVSQHKISDDLKQENKYIFFAFDPVAKNKSTHVESLQQSAPDTMLK